MHTGRYRRESEPTNYICDKCPNKIWIRKSEFNHTQYNGKMYYSTNRLNLIPESIIRLEGKRILYVCYECFRSEGGGLEN